MTPDDLKQRTFEFGRRAILFCIPLFKRIETRALAEQLIRSGPGVGAHYRAACCGRSRADFIAKIGTTIEEADESEYWLAQLVATKLAEGGLVESLRGEAEELCAIFKASRRTAEQNRSRDRARKSGKSGSNRVRG